jgi:hypothetical protein
MAMPGGETIRGLEQESGARIKVDQASSNAEERKILLYGKFTDMIAATEYILEPNLATSQMKIWLGAREAVVLEM